MHTIPSDIIRFTLRRRCLAMVISLAVCAGSAVPSTAQPQSPGTTAENLQEAFVSIGEVYKPLVVSITTSKTVKEAVPQYEFFFGDPFEMFFDNGSQDQRRSPRRKYMKRKFEGGGSGVIIDPAGYVLTNNHLVSEADTIKVHFSNDGEKSYDATVVGKDPYTDLAVIKIKSDKKFAAAKLGDSDQLRVGDWVIAIGSPFGLEQTLTAGIVSARRQSLDIEGQRYENLIQTDAAINRGNSGGPLVNIKGEVVGINTAIFAPTGVFSGIGFAVPVNKAKEVIKDLIEKGKVTRGWLGIEIRDLDDTLARQFGVTDKAGVLVNRVVPGSSAAKGGLRRGDVIRECNNVKIKNAAELQALVRKLAPGKPMRLVVVRGGKEAVVNFPLGEMTQESVQATQQPQKEKAPDGQVQWESIAVQNLTPDIAQALGVDGSMEGVVVSGVTASAPDLGLREGDIIRGINRDEIKNIDDFKKVTKKVDLAKGAVFDIIREGAPVYVTYEGK